LVDIANPYPELDLVQAIESTRFVRAFIIMNLTIIDGDQGSENNRARPLPLTGKSLYFGTLNNAARNLVIWFQCKSNKEIPSD
jgi:hypothetical protein